MSEFDSFVVNIIQRTPHIDTLCQKLARMEFPSVECNRLVTQYLKARRLYDELFKASFDFNEVKNEKLRKVFAETGNGYAGDTLLSSKIPDDFDSQKFWRSSIEPLVADPEQMLQYQDDRSLRITRLSFMQIFGAVKVGNVPKLKALMREVATKCVLLNVPRTVFTSENLDIDAVIRDNVELFRFSLRNALLNKRDWIDKTLLHVATDCKTNDCIDIVLKFAHEAGVKAEMLDSKDAFGNSPLILALRRRDAPKSKKLIIEGADIYLTNHKNQFPLQLIYQRFPEMGLFLMDMAITVSGEVSSEAFFLNVDFGVISTYIEVVEDVENRLLPQRHLEATERRKFFKEMPFAHVVPIEDVQEMTTFASPTNMAQNISNASSNTSYMKELQRNEEQMRILAFLAYNDMKSCSHLLQHPVTRLFLNLKWNKLKWFVYANSLFRMFYYFIYLAITFRIYFVDCPHRSLNEAEFKNTKSIATDSLPDTRDSILNVGKYDGRWSSTTLILLPIVTFLTTFFICAEIFKLPLILQVRQLRYYWFSYLGMGAWTRFSFFAVAVATTTTPFYVTQLHSSQYPLAIIGALLGSVLLLQVLGDSNFSFIVHSIYVHVYTRVLMRFLTVVTTFSVLILGFAISFSIVFPQPKEFSTFARSIFRLLIMIHGEFDFEDKSLKADSDGDAWAFWSGQILYVLFSSIITLVLIDVFLGYTVSDINELKDQAEDVRRLIQIQQIFIMEKAILSLRQILKVLFKYEGNKLQFSVIPASRLKRNRNDVMIGFEELDEVLQSELRDFIS